MIPQPSLNIRLINATVGLIALILTVYILIIGKNILIPIVTAIVIWYLIIRLTHLFKKIPFTKILLPESLAIILALLMTFLLLYGLVNMIAHSINNIISDAPQYQAKLHQFIGFINELTDSEIQFNQLAHKINLTSIFSSLAITLTNIASNFSLIIIYVAFMLVEYKSFNKKLDAIAEKPQQRKTMQETITRMSSDINMYLKVKSSLSLLTAFASYIALVSFGIHYAQFWAVLIFLLDFIPTFGSIIAILVTVLAVSIQFNSIGMLILLTAILIGIQFIVANLLEPRWMGKNLNLSPLVILISLAFWGSIWGILGMFLCVPLMTIINIILSKFQNTRHLSVLLAANPDIVER